MTNNVRCSPVGRVLVVDDHAAARESLADILRCAGHKVDALSSATEALKRLAGESYDVVLTDLKMPGMTGLQFIQELERRPHGAQVIMITAYASVASAVEAMRHGAFDYIEKPFSVEQIEALVSRALSHGQAVDFRGPARPAATHVCMIGSSRALSDLRALIARVAPTNETVLIAGESGTGKELVARMIHAQSTRSNGPLVSVNCPVLAAQLTESELFGHERGAFTGAESPRTGRFELAEGGTLHLDEITEINLGLQAKLLRVLQERTFERVGSSETRRVDVRVVASTNRNLREEVAAARFREDLYYRLAVVPLHLPPLRERLEDLPELVDHFLGQAGERLGRQAAMLDESALDLLLNYRWPGNVRELENLITRASILSDGLTISADQLKPWLLDPTASVRPETATIPAGIKLEEMEQKLIEATLERFGGHRAKTAAALGIGVRTLSGKLKAYGYSSRKGAA